MFYNKYDKYQSRRYINIQQNFRYDQLPQSVLQLDFSGTWSQEGGSFDGLSDYKMFVHTTLEGYWTT